MLEVGGRGIYCNSACAKRKKRPVHHIKEERVYCQLIVAEGYELMAQAVRKRKGGISSPYYEVIYE
jgi:hypothetical protein